MNDTTPGSTAHDGAETDAPPLTELHPVNDEGIVVENRRTGTRWRWKGNAWVKIDPWPSRWVAMAKEAGAVPVEFDCEPGRIAAVGTGGVAGDAHLLRASPSVAPEGFVDMHPDIVDAIEWLRGPLAEYLNEDGEIADAIAVNALADRLVDLAIPTHPAAGWIDRETATRWAKAIVRHHDEDRWLPDHACEECVGSHGSMVHDGFRCVFHEAKAYLANRPPAAPVPSEGKPS